jgi:hypothetical protein
MTNTTNPKCRATFPGEALGILESYLEQCAVEAPQAATTEQAGPRLTVEQCIQQFRMYADGCDKLGNAEGARQLRLCAEFLSEYGPAATTASAPQYENVTDHSGKIIGVRMTNADQMPSYGATTASASGVDLTDYSQPVVYSNNAGRAPAPSREAAVPQFGVTSILRSIIKDGYLSETNVGRARAALAGRDAAPLDELWMHEDMDRDATEAILNLPGKELKAYFVQAREDVATWRRRALTAEAALAKPAAPVVDGELVEAMRPHLFKADGGYTCDTAPEHVAAAGHAAIAAARSAPVGEQVAWLFENHQGERGTSLLAHVPRGVAQKWPLYLAAPSHPEPAGGKEQA